MGAELNGQRLGKKLWQIVWRGVWRGVDCRTCTSPTRIYRCRWMAVRVPQTKSFQTGQIQAHTPCAGG